MYYYFYSTDLIRFIFSYTHCFAMKLETFRNFWQNFVRSLSRNFNAILDFGKYYHSNHYGTYDSPAEELQHTYHIFINFGNCILIDSINTPYDPEYATDFLDSIKKAQPIDHPQLIHGLLKAIDTIKDDLAYTNEDSHHLL